ncbi:MAG: PEP-CTERM sorting domain-containing protein [Verrucomicrobiota bacterium]
MKTKIALILMAGLVAGSAGATAIAIDDWDFASQTVNYTQADVAHDAGTTEWDSNYDVGNAKFRLSTFTDHTSGNVCNTTDPYGIAYTGGGVWIQDTGITYVEGYTYTFKLWALTSASGDSGGANPIQLRMTLTDASDPAGTWGGNILGDTGYQVLSNYYDGSGTYDNWAQLTLEYTATASDAGKNIGVGFRGGGGDYVYADDVTLDVVPEPGTMGLFGLTGLGIMLVRRIKR